MDLEEANDADLDNGSSRGRTTHLYYSGNSVTFDYSSTPNSKLYDNSSSGISASSISAAGDSMTLTISKNAMSSQSHTSSVSFVAVGTSGTILTSSDGTTWTSRTSGTSNALNDVAYGTVNSR